MRIEIMIRNIFRSLCWFFVFALLFITSFSQAAALFNGNIVLGSPTDTSIKANILSYQGQTVYLQYGQKSGDYTAETELLEFAADEAQEIEISGLEANTRYYYQIVYRADGGEFVMSDEYSFHTQRAPGSRFVFGVQGDSHPERSHSFVPELYDTTLQQAKDDGVDFYFTTGDDFSIDNIREKPLTEPPVIERYLIQRPHLGLLGNSAPIFLVNGNHEQGALYLYNDASKYPAPDNPAVWVQNARNTYFPQPEPNHFYTGNDEDIKYIDKGLQGTYYAFEWGDALFVTLDPFWSSPKAVDNVFEGGRGADAELTKTPNKWDITIGDAQYHWLKTTLEDSDAKFKFIFAHMMHGTIRGGVENAQVYEWGGHSRKGVNGIGEYEFDEKRPNWDKPIHQLMVDTNVTVFFHAHDHLWATQELDGVIYQEMPSPADTDYDDLGQWAKAYTHPSTVMISNTGYARVTVTSEAATVDYVRTYLPEDENDDRKTGDVAYTYTVAAPPTNNNN